MKAVGWALGRALGRGWGSSEAQTTARIMLADPCEDGNPMGVVKLCRGPQRRVVWMWFGAFPGAFGLGRAQPQRRGTSP